MPLAIKGLLLGLCVIAIDYLFVGFAFHKYQARTPHMWRPEGMPQYVASMIIDLWVGFGIAFFVAGYGGALGLGAPGAAVRFAFSLWAVFVLPVLLILGFFLNWHRMFWIGLMLDWAAIIVVVTSAAAAWIL